MKSRLFVRHAQSLSNAGFATNSPGTIGLSELGLRQAQAFAEQCVTAPDLVIVSPYTRTSDTAAPLLAKFPECPVITMPIHEFTFLAPARYAGTTEQDRREPARNYWTNADPDYCDGEGAESFRAFIERIESAFETICQRPEKNIIAFSHGYVMKALAWRLLSHERQVSSDYMSRFFGYHRAQVVCNTHVFPFVQHADGEVSLMRTVAPPALPALT